MCLKQSSGELQSHPGRRALTAPAEPRPPPAGQGVPRGTRTLRKGCRSRSDWRLNHQKRLSADAEAARSRFPWKFEFNRAKLRVRRLQSTDVFRHPGPAKEHAALKPSREVNTLEENRSNATGGNVTAGQINPLGLRPLTAGPPSGGITRPIG